MIRRSQLLTLGGLGLFFEACTFLAKTSSGAVAERAAHASVSRVPEPPGRVLESSSAGRVPEPPTMVQESTRTIVSLALPSVIQEERVAAAPMTKYPADVAPTRFFEFDFCGVLLAASKVHPCPAAESEMVLVFRCFALRVLTAECPDLALLRQAIKGVSSNGSTWQTAALKHLVALLHHQQRERQRRPMIVMYC